MSVSRNIKLIRKKQGMTLDELAAGVGVTKSTVARYESGDIKYVSADMIKKNATVLDCSEEDLLGDDPRYSLSASSSEDADLVRMFSSLNSNQKNIIRQLVDSWKVPQY